MSAASVGVVRELDPTDETRLRSWWEIGRDAEAERALDVWPAWETARVAYVLPPPDRDQVFLAAYDGERMVGAARVDLPREDNTHLAIVLLFVAPPERGRGVGTRLLAAVEDRARAAGRTTCLAEVHAPAGADSASLRFALARGYPVAGNEDLKVADLAGTSERWPALAARADERLGEYALVAWTDTTPEEHVAGLCALYSRFLGEIPLGDLDLQPQRWTPAKLRAAEARRAAYSRRCLVVAALAPAGDLVGYTQLVVDAGAPHLGLIDSTLVLPEHRGHRLGLAMKVRLHQETRERLPGCAVIVTGNADVNDHMNAVNEQLGYLTVERCLDVQRVLPTSGG